MGSGSEKASEIKYRVTLNISRMTGSLKGGPGHIHPGFLKKIQSSFNADLIN